MPAVYKYRVRHAKTISLVSHRNVFGKVKIFSKIIHLHTRNIQAKHFYKQPFSHKPPIDCYCPILRDMTQLSMIIYFDIIVIMVLFCVFKIKFICPCRFYFEGFNRKFSVTLSWGFRINQWVKSQTAA